MKFDIEKIEKYVEEGLLIKQKHPSFALSIYNYSQNVQYGDLWDDTLIHCRGLILDEEGNVVAKPFKKFFNLEENKHKPSGNFSIWEKVDGSLGILFYYENEWHLATRGSFTSDQAIKGRELLKNYDGFEKQLNKNFTYLFEIIYKENRIVLDYGEEMLVLLGAVDIETGEEFTPDQLGIVLFPLPYRYLFLSGDTFEKLKALNYNDEEGFVVHFDNGEKCKIKFAWYLERHKVVWSLTNTLVWEYLSTGRKEELFEMIPDEYYEKLKNVIQNFENLFDIRKLEYEELFKDIQNKTFKDIQSKSSNRKEFALIAKDKPFNQILFKMYDEREVSETIWKTIKPSETVKLLTL